MTMDYMRNNKMEEGPLKENTQIERDGKVNILNKFVAFQLNWKGTQTVITSLLSTHIDVTSLDFQSKIRIKTHEIRLKFGFFLPQKYAFFHQVHKKCQ